VYRGVDVDARSEAGCGGTHGRARSDQEGARGPPRAL